MNTPNRLLTIAAIVGFSAFAADKPNVVLILADDMGYGDVGYHGTRKMMTPNIDKLAAGGIHFTQGYVSASVCGPSRSGLLTGVYQQRFGCGENPNCSGYPDKMKFPLAGLPRSQSIVSEILKANGYNTGMIGKWHLGIDDSLRPNARGFDFYYGFLNGAHDYNQWDNKWAKNKGRWPLFRNNKMLPPAKDVYLTDLFSDEAVGFIEKATKPFFLYVAYNAVHHPWQVPEKYTKRTRTLGGTEDFTVFAGMALAMDDGVGRIVKALADKGVTDNTMVIFLSDNGSPQGQGLKPAKKDPNCVRGGTSMSSPGPFRGFKGDTYEGGTHVPFLIKWPGKIKPGTKYELPISALDIVPTICARLGVATPLKGHAFDGVDLLPYFTGKKGNSRPHEKLYWRRDNDYAMRKGDWKLTWNDAHGTTEIMLFNLATDPGEYKNVAGQYPEMVQKLQDEFDAWDSQQPDNEWWGGPWNRNRSYAKGNRVNVMKFNQSPPTGRDAHKKFRKKK